MNRFLTTLTLLSLCIVALCSVPVLAQTTDEVTKVRDAIERNAELLEQARELVRTTSSTKARLSLDAATKLHEESVRLLNLSTDRNGLARAGTVAKKARDAILQTIAIAKREAILEESAKKAVARATDRLDRARRIVSEVDAGNQLAANRVVEEATIQLQRSRDNLREHLFEVALRLALSSEQLSTQAIGMVRRDTPGNDFLQREIEKTERLLERLGDRLGSDLDPRIQRMFDEALELAARAKQAYRANQTGTALELSQQARATALRATKIYSSQANNDNVERALRLTGALIDEAREVAKERRSDEMLKDVDRAQQLQSDAKKQFAADNYDQALGLTLRAREILKDSLNAVKSDLNPADVEPTLRGTDKFLSGLNEEIKRSGNDVAKDLLARANQKQKVAWQSFRDNELRAALANTRLARKLGNRVLEQLENENL